jgi:hypothetical protein
MLGSGCPCPASTPLPCICAWVWSAVPTAGLRWRWAWSGTDAGYQGWVVPRRAGEGGGPLAPGARGSYPIMISTFPMMVNTLVGLLYCFLIHLFLPRSQASRSASLNAKTSSPPSGPTKSRGLGPARAAGAKWFWRPRTTTDEAGGHRGILTRTITTDSTPIRQTTPAINGPLLCSDFR